MCLPGSPYDIIELMIPTTSADKPTLKDVRFESLFNSAKKSVMERGRASFYLKRALVNIAEDAFAQVIVNDFEVDVWLDPDHPYRYIHVDCDCRDAHYNPDGLCEHKVCALLALQDFYRQPTALKPNWIRILDRVIGDESVDKKREPKNVVFYEIVRGYSGHSIEPCLMPIEHLDGCALDDSESIARSIVKRDLYKHAKEIYSTQSLNRVLNRSATDMATARLLADRWRRTTYPSR